MGVKDARSKTFGTAVIVEIPAVAGIVGTQKPLGFVDFGGGNTTVVPLGMFDQKERVIFIPNGNVAPEGDFFDWLGKGRRRIVRKRKFLKSLVSTGIIAPLDLLPKNYAQYNDVRVGVNVAKALGVYTPLPPTPNKIKGRTKRKRDEKAKKPCALDVPVSPLDKSLATEQAHFSRARAIIDFGSKNGVSWYTDGNFIYSSEQWLAVANEKLKADLKTLKPYAIKVLMAGPNGDPMRKEAEAKVLAGLNAQISGDMAKLEPMRSIPDEAPKPKVDDRVVTLAKLIHEGAKHFHNGAPFDDRTWENMPDSYKGARFRQAQYVIDRSGFDGIGEVKKFLKQHFNLEFPNIEAGVIGALLGLDASYKSAVETIKVKDKLLSRLTDASKRYIIGTEFIGQQMDKLNEKNPFDPWG